MQIDIFYINCNPLGVWGPAIIQSLSIILQHLSGKFREWMYCRQTTNIWPVLFQTTNHDVYKGVLQRLCDSTQHRCPKLWAKESSSSCMTKCGPIHTSPCQYNKSLYRYVYHVLKICHQAIFFLFPLLNEHWKATATMTNGHSGGCDKTALQHSSKCFAGLLQRPREMLETVYQCRRKLFQRRPLAPECK